MQERETKPLVPTWDYGYVWGMKSEIQSNPLANTHSTYSGRHNNAIATWLFSVAGVVFLMIIVGAITRLTESGLSMVEWRPLIGFIPPLNDADWQKVFDLYKATPEFQKKNFWMGIDDFKQIFFWEWFHRVIGRLIGLVYALPFFYFLIRRQIPKGYVLKLFGLLLLGGAQGFMGWYMVQSGLIDRPSVSHYRLAAHLSLAFLILCLLVIYGLSLKGYKRTPSRALHIHGWITLAFLIPTIFWGAFVAGLDAGLIYNEFPKMGDGLIPPEMWHLSPAWINLFENIPSVQFVHRWLAMTTALVILSLWAHALRTGKATGIFHTLAAIVCVQIILGILTLLSGVNIVLATAHQGGAAILLATTAICIFKTKPSKT